MSLSIPTIMLAIAGFASPAPAAGLPSSAPEAVLARASAPAGPPAEPSGEQKPPPQETERQHPVPEVEPERPAPDTEREPPPPPADDLDFDLLGPAPVAPPSAVSQEIIEQAQRRRSLLGAHQIFGLGTLVTMGATVVLGALNYRDLYGGGGRSGDLQWPHRIGVMATTAEFATAGTLALLAPEPYESDVEGRGISTATLHKTAAFLATLGMLTQLGVGFVTARQADAGNSDNLRTLARVHQAVGYTTLALVATAAVVWVF